MVSAIVNGDTTPLGTGDDLAASTTASTSKTGDARVGSKGGIGGDWMGDLLLDQFAFRAPPVSPPLTRNDFAPSCSQHGGSFLSAPAIVNQDTVKFCALHYELVAGGIPKVSSAGLQG
jgi:hypothetical protein